MKTKNKKSVILGITILLLVTFTLLGLTYAYYRTRIIGNTAENSISVKSNKLELTYTNGSEIFDDKIVPGDIITKKFTVENTGNGNVQYGIYLENVVNELVNKKDLRFDITCVEKNADGDVVGDCYGKSDWQYPDTNSKVVGNLIGSKSLHEYTINVRYVETSEDQTADMRAKLKGQIKIHIADNVFDLVVAAANLSETDTLELHSDVKSATNVNGTFTFVGVEVGQHELFVKNKNGEILGSKEIVIEKGASESFVNNTITMTDAASMVKIQLDNIVNNEIVLGGVTQENNYAIKLGNTKYTSESIGDVISNSSKDEPAILLQDVVVPNDIIVNKNSVEMSFDLNGHKLSCDNCDTLLRLNGTNSTLNISNGNIEVKDGTSAIIVGQNSYEPLNTKIVVEKDVIINSDSYGVVVLGNNASLDLYGQINMNGAGYAISGSGNSGNADTVINIYHGAVINANAVDSFALYLPQFGVTNIYGGTLTGNSVVLIKAGTLNIMGGTLNAIGEKLTTFKDSCVYTGDNYNTGDVIFVQLNDKYKKNISINVENSATLKSTNANVVRVFACYVADLNDSSNIVNVTGKYTNVSSDGTNMTVYN